MPEAVPSTLRRLRAATGRLLRPLGLTRWPRPGRFDVHLATCVRNEGPYLLEWIGHHLLLGFDRVTIFSNDNDDGSDALLAALRDRGLIDWRPRRLAAHEIPQDTAFAAYSRELFADWGERGNYLAWFDCDEYLVLRRHDSVRALLEHYRRPDALLVNWKHFGSGGETDYRDAPTLERFVRCSSKSNHDQFFKCLARIDPWQFVRLTGHRPFIRDRHSRPRIAYASPDGGAPAAADVLAGANPVGIASAPAFHEVCQLNHYAVRSFAEFRAKHHRGDGIHPVTTGGNNYRPEYFNDLDLNEETDSFARDRYLPGVRTWTMALPSDILAIDRDIKRDFARRWGSA